ncbi:integrase core domain-containing protein [Streptomyces brasiliscabiei]|uniref:Integrase core domain-containing protein n=1 Tax=Streptomyces brasiliscabiei TaxID=2736302 RepID=A0ABU8GN80_9ACTN
MPSLMEALEALEARRAEVLGQVERLREQISFDNAVSEAFNSVLKAEGVHRHRFATRSEARLKIATWITDFYNTRRIHSVCDFASPVDFEQQYWAQQVRQQAAQIVSTLRGD